MVPVVRFATEPACAREHFAGVVSTLGRRFRPIDASRVYNLQMSAKLHLNYVVWW
jgi:hypothetical protein